MRSRRTVLCAVLAFAIVLSPVGCGQQEAVPTPIPTLVTRPTPAATAAPTATPVPPHGPRLLEQSPAPGAELAPGTPLEFVFDQPMDRASVEAAFSISPAVPGTFEWPAPDTMRFVPDEKSLAPDAEYDVTIGIEAKNQHDLSLAREVRFAQRVAGPIVVGSVFPLPDSMNVSSHDRVIVTFNRPVVPLAGIAEAGDLPSPLTLSPAVAGSGAWTNTSVYTLTPSEPLQAGVTYTATVPAGLELAGSALQEPYTWQFTVAPPGVVMTTPLPDEALVDPATTVVLEFSEEMDRTTATERFQVTNRDGESVPGRIDWQGSLLRFRPDTALERGATYSVRLTAGAGVASGGATLPDDQAWTFTVAPAPAVVATSPHANERNVGTYSALQVTFSAPMDTDLTAAALTITPTVSTYTFWQGDNTELWVSWTLKPSTRYTVTLSTRAKDRFGTPLPEPTELSFETGPLDPSISLLTEGPIGLYSAYADAAISIRHTNVATIALALYELTPEQLVLLTREGGYPDWDRFAVTAGSRTATWTLDAQAPLNSTGVLSTPLPGDATGPLPAGIYYLTATAPGVNWTERHAFVVSPMNVTLKTTDAEALVWVTGLEDGQPLEGVDVTLYDYDGVLFREGRTDTDGIALLPMPEQERWESVTVVATLEDAMGAVVSNWSDGVSPWEFGLDAAWERAPIRGYLFTDRRIYQPGQTVLFKAILRNDDDGHYSLPDAGTSVSARMIDSQGRDAWTGDLRLGEFGSLDGQVTLADSAPLGPYTLVLAYGEQFFETAFQVAEYRAPEFRVGVATGEPEYVAGDSMTVDVDATFFFGGPVSGADVQWRLFGEPYYFDRWTGPGWYSFEYYDMSNDSSGVLDTGLLTEGTGTTDSDGRLTIAVPTDLQGSASRRFRVEVSVVDVNNQEVTGQASAIVHRGELYVGLNTDRYVSTAGEAMRLGVVSADTQGHAMPRQSVAVAISRQEWYSVQEQTADGGYLWSNEVRDTPVFTQTVRTGADGLASLAWTPPEGGTYRVVATAQDPDGNRVQSALYVWVSGTAFVNWGRENNHRIDLVSDKTEYAPGDVATVLVPSPFTEPATALVTIERGNILDRRVVTLATNSETLEIPIEDDYAPNVFVSVVLVSGTGGDDDEPGYRVGMVMLPVSTIDRELRVSVTPDREGGYQPGDEASFELLATDSQGNPVEAEFTVQVVDLAIETLIGGTPPSILDAFYRARGLAVNTALSLVRRHVADDTPGDDGKGGGGGDESGLRTDFPETALWEPSVRTGSDGRASVGLTLPDNLTTWRLTAQGTTADTLVGSATADIVSNLDVMVRPAVPRFLVIGDEPRLSAVVHNNTGGGLELRVSLAAEGLEVEDAEQTVVIAAGARQALYWPATVGVADQAVLTFEARSGDHRDAVRITVPVYYASTPEVVGTSGVVDDSLTEVIRVPGQADANQGDLTVTVEPSLAAAMQAGLEYLETYPYGCIEQTVSRFLPNLAVQRAVRELRIDDADLAAALPEQVSVSLQRVYALQNADGGWSWWGNGESSAVISAYVVLGLARAQQEGYTVDAFALQRAVEYLISYLDTTPPVTRDDYDTRAGALYALAETGSGDLGRATALFEARDNLSLFAKAYLAMTLHLLEPNEASRVDALVNEIAQEGILSSTGLHWEEEERATWQMNTDTRTTAIVVRALVWVDPENDLLPQAVRWLMMARSSGRWESTQENVWAILALTDYMLSTGELDADFTYVVSVNGATALSGEVDSASLVNPQAAILPMTALEPGEDTFIRFDREPGGGAGHLYYSVFLRYLLPIERIEALDRGIVVYREYRTTGGDQVVTRASVNDTVDVHLTLVAPHDLFYLVMEDPLPAGCEALDPALATTRTLDEQSQELIPQDMVPQDAPWWRQSWPSHTELHSEKLSLFAASLPRGTYEYTYQVRCTTAGEYRVIPAQAYEMYEPDVFGRSSGSTFTVTP